MKKQLRKNLTQNDRLQPQAQTEIFSFGDPIPVLDRADILNYLECSAMYEKWYNPPMSFDGLAKSLRSSTHHESAIITKANILLSTCEVDSRYLSRRDLSSFVKDYLVFGNAYFEVVRNRLGQVQRIESPLAKYVRKGLEAGQFYYVPQRFDHQEHEFAKGSIYHLLEPDINQDIYGLPQYLSALQSAWLNESATLFRRKYFLNGAHAGFVFYMTENSAKQGDVDNIREQLRKSKGVGNFKNLFVHSPGGNKDGIQIIPIADVSAKDEFFNIKNVSRDDVLAAHRVPPQLMGIIPNNTGGFGNVADAAEVFFITEIEPLQERLKEFNQWLGQEVIKFKPSKLLQRTQ
ncbi:TPA: phage portal protein [Mannheimia haemolytica]|uniref:Capsid portal protein Q n=1 Tax=Mannheimia phage vB_MhM_1127AP1 TaxID=1572746 RepID=A0A0M3LQ03_9CAUD|nr:phage portal protein [Mannheimia haemolytica]YP_009784986.1 portal protein [Mannheimia phage vB_MhM_1127AP1]AJA73053.1 capsid portal protein Q [Mannheimia phage vB_MhM_1127AP1]AJE08871.1 phage portal protein [Mannheimia haemolytica USDA-ARS-USMARC-184]KYL06389.1 portal vertex protein [Mannheimia haemolytica]QEB85316.1 phage portal protein [Mannheimia haemolytica]QEB87740.1 phage portal protein [Mannheimia haemolytica]